MHGLAVTPPCWHWTRLRTGIPSSPARTVKAHSPQSQTPRVPIETRAVSGSLPVLPILFLPGLCVSVLACGGDEESDLAAAVTPTANVEAKATPVLLATLTAPAKATATGHPYVSTFTRSHTFCCSGHRIPSPVPTAIPSPIPSPSPAPTVIPSPIPTPSPSPHRHAFHRYLRLLPVPTTTPSPLPAPTAMPQRDFDAQQYIGKGDEYNCGDFEYQWQAQANAGSGQAGPKPTG